MSTSTFPPVKEFFLLGKTLKSHGTGGHLRLLVEDRFRSYIKPGAFVFLDLDGSRVPFMVQAVEDGQHFVMLLADIKGKQESDTLTGKEIWLPLEQVKPRHQKSPRNINEKWDDYRIHDQKSGLFYAILRTEEYPQQLMAVVDIEGRDILIPLSDQLITEIDKDQKIIHMEIPEGLLEL
ncbi:MAG: hypothetical protein IPP25_04550 [Saprospiraceae bacterium]|nr:hypothetical protein [Candidatus Opimibacter skivensis]